MYTKELFNETLAILVNAYLNDTLEAGNCCACAVGNIVASRSGYKIIKDRFNQINWDGVPYPGSVQSDKSKEGGWGAAVCTSGFTSTQYLSRDNYERYPNVKQQIDSTGYTLEDVGKIEYAFETSYAGQDPMFNALMSVVDVLCEIHGMNEQDKKESKALFVKV